MRLRHETILKSDGWQITHVEVKEDEQPNSEYYNLKYRIGNDLISTPFTHVVASGGMIELYKCETVDADKPRETGNMKVSISSALTSRNRLADTADMPEDIFKKLREIGPW